MAHNIVNPLALEYQIVEQYTLPTSTSVEAYVLVKQNGEKPGNAKPDGVSTSDASSGVYSLVVRGILPVKVAAGKAIAINDSLTYEEATGRVQKGDEATDVIIGKALSSCDNTGTLERPFYVNMRVNL